MESVPCSAELLSTLEYVRDAMARPSTQLERGRSDNGAARRAYRVVSWDRLTTTMLGHEQAVTREHLVEAT